MRPARSRDDGAPRLSAQPPATSLAGSCVEIDVAVAPTTEARSLAGSETGFLVMHLKDSGRGCVSFRTMQRAGSTGHDTRDSGVTRLRGGDSHPQTRLRVIAFGVVSPAARSQPRAIAMRPHLLVVGGNDSSAVKAAGLDIDVTLFQLRRLLTQKQIDAVKRVSVFDFQQLDETIAMATAVHSVQPLHATVSFWSMRYCRLRRWRRRSAFQPTPRLLSG